MKTCTKCGVSKSIKDEYILPSHDVCRLCTLRIAAKGRGPIAACAKMMLRRLGQ